MKISEVHIGHAEFSDDAIPVVVALEDGTTYFYRFDLTVGAVIFRDMVRASKMGDSDYPAVGEYLSDLVMIAEKVRHYNN